jgi:hypothetical protein
MAVNFNHVHKFIELGMTEKETFKLNVKNAAREEQNIQIHDGPDFFKTSVVEYVRFPTFELRLMFAYLREKEQCLQDDVHRYKVADSPAWKYFKVKLQEVEAMLIFMAHNIPEAGSLEEMSEFQLKAWRRAVGLKKLKSGQESVYDQISLIDLNKDKK